MAIHALIVLGALLFLLYFPGQLSWSSKAAAITEQRTVWYFLFTSFFSRHNSHLKIKDWLFSYYSMKAKIAIMESQSSLEKYKESGNLEGLAPAMVSVTCFTFFGFEVQKTTTVPLKEKETASVPPPTEE